MCKDKKQQKTHTKLKKKNHLGAHGPSVRGSVINLGSIICVCACMCVSVLTKKSVLTVWFFALCVLLFPFCHIHDTMIHVHFLKVIN